MRRLVERTVIKEAVSTAPSVYVGTYGKYNAGSIKGAWLNLDDYASKDEFLKAAEEIHKDEADPELMFQDYEGFPKRYYGESSLDDKLWDWLALDEDDRELLEVYIDSVGDKDATIEDARDHFRGKYKSEEDWAEAFLDEIGGLSPEDAPSYLSVSETDARMIGNEEADSTVRDMDDEEVVEKADMEEEYDAAIDAEQKDRIVEKARDTVRGKISDEIEDAINKDAVGYFVDATGMYTIESLMKADFISIDYEAYARDAQSGGDVSFVRKDGEVWVFSNL